jgi:FkbM family methyltransferase
LLNRARRLRYRGEPEGVEFLLNRDLKGKVCLDIGAHRGAYTYWMCQAVGRAGKVIGFEPQPELAVYLAKLHPCFRLPGLTFESLALSNSAGARLLLRRPNEWGGGGLHDLSTTGCEQIPVRTETLDGYLAQQGMSPVSFIKCDVEGHEEQVFRGGERMLTRDRPALLFESHHRVAATGSLFRYLEGIGYMGFLFAFRKLHPMRYWNELIGRDNPHLTNYVFVSPSDAASIAVATAAERAAFARQPRLWSEQRAA